MTTKSYQARVKEWVLKCFGQDIADDISERNHRFLEEALELVQSTGCTAEEAHKLVGYVFSRPVGDTKQEIGGVSVTLAALCSAAGIDQESAAEAELARVSESDLMNKIREKQKSKPAMSPLPGVYPERAILKSSKQRLNPLAYEIIIVVLVLYALTITSWFHSEILEVLSRVF